MIKHASIALAAVAALVAAPAATTRPAATHPAAEQALAAALSWQDVKRVLPGGAGWWPELPQFTTGIEPGSTANPAVSIQYDQVGSSSQLFSAVSFLPSAKAAAADYARRTKVVDTGGRTVTGPKVAADEWRYFTRPAKPLVETTLRFRVGSVVGRVSAFDAKTWPTQRLAALFTPVAQRLRAVLAGGKVPAAAPPAAVAAALPPAAAAPGAVLGTAFAPRESWAIIDASRNPSGIVEGFAKNGLPGLGIRVYALKGSPGNVVEAVLFPFASSRAAAEWISGYADEVGSKALAAGNTGEGAAFAAHDNLYELQFAKGRFAADVTCTAPFATTAKACEAAVRSFAERWYAALAA